MGVYCGELLDIKINYIFIILEFAKIVHVLRFITKTTTVIQFFYQMLYQMILRK